MRGGSDARQTREVLALGGREVEDVDQTLHDLARGTQRPLFDALNGHPRTAHAAGELLLGQVERLAALLERLRERGSHLQGHLLQQSTDSQGIGSYDFLYCLLYDSPPSDATPSRLDWLHVPPDPPRPGTRSWQALLT